MTLPPALLSSVQAAPVLDLLLADETNPRSLVFNWSPWPSTSSTCRTTTGSRILRPSSRLPSPLYRPAAGNIDDLTAGECPRPATEPG